MEQYIKAYYDILSKADSGKIFKGTSSGFVQASQDILSDPAGFIFKECQVKSELDDLTTDKIFTVKFSTGIDMDSLEDAILLIDSENGDSIETEIKKSDDKTVTIKAKNNLKNKHEYYLVVNNNVQTSQSAVLKNCTVVKAVTK